MEREVAQLRAAASGRSLLAALPSPAAILSNLGLDGTTAGSSGGRGELAPGRAAEDRERGGGGGGGVAPDVLRRLPLRPALLGAASRGELLPGGAAKARGGAGQLGLRAWILIAYMLALHLAVMLMSARSHGGGCELAADKSLPG